MDVDVVPFGVLVNVALGPGGAAAHGGQWCVCEICGRIRGYTCVSFS